VKSIRNPYTCPRGLRPKQAFPYTFHGYLVVVSFMCDVPGTIQPTTLHSTVPGSYGKLVLRRFFVELHRFYSRYWWLYLVPLQLRRELAFGTYRPYLVVLIYFYSCKASVQYSRCHTIENTYMAYDVVIK